MTHPLVEAARAYLGCPFKHQGRARHGMDCAGLAVISANDCGMYPKDVSGYGREPFNAGLEATLVAACGEPIDQSTIQPGDVLMMRFTGEPQHIAIVTDYIGGGLGIIHAHAGVQKVTEHRLDEKWTSRIVKAYRPTMP